MLSLISLHPEVRYLGALAYRTGSYRGQAALDSANPLTAGAGCLKVVIGPSTFD